MRILLLAQFNRYGGTREAFKRILDVHQSKGFQTHVIIQHGSDDQIKRFITEKGASFSEMSRRGKFFNNIITSLLYEHLNYRSLLKDWNPDLVVASTGTSKYMLYPFIRKYPLVYILHTIPKELSIHLKYFFKIFSSLAGRNQWICGVSKATVASVIRNWGYDSNQTEVLHNTFNKEHVSTNAAEKDHRAIIVLTLGQVVPYKNPRLWLNVARQITGKYDNVKFTWLGDGKLLEEFQEETKDETQIEFPGYIENMKDYYSKATIYFQPSIIENHSFSVLDAMANSLPCVVSDVGGQPDSIQDGLNGYLCEKDDEAAFTARIKELIENPKLLKKLGDLARTKALAEFNPDHYEEKLAGLYKKVLGSGSDQTEE